MPTPRRAADDDGTVLRYEHLKELLDGQERRFEQFCSTVLDRIDALALAAQVSREQMRDEMAKAREAMVVHATKEDAHMGMSADLRQMETRLLIVETKLLTQSTTLRNVWIGLGILAGLLLALLGLIQFDAGPVPWRAP